ncbi:unnamed protein product [Pneumocystis jirovecii]|uniref:Kinetochore protein mis13 n=1 Tax=Pneumocystis jirovecii TaxID=42068 RepID=L0PG41_PNEJI|nr:unnamed protein product [Pneumocystis jirovecii]
MRALPDTRPPSQPLHASHLSADTLLNFSTHTSHTTDSFVALPVSDTPVIEKNRDLRQRRRSSLGFRGKRASSILSNGLIALPHPSISHESFFKHISEDLPEAVRMKQLLVWCAKRALDDQKMYETGGIEEGKEAVLLARKIGEEILSDLIENRLSASWYCREVRGKLFLSGVDPHPRNVENRKKIKEFEARLKKYGLCMATGEEIERWNRLEASFLSCHGEKSEEKSEERRKEEEKVEGDKDSMEGEGGDENVLDKMVEGAFLPSKEVKWVPPAKHAELRGWIESVEGGLEFKVDQLYHTMYSIESFGQVSSQYAARLLSHVAKAIEERKRQAEIETGSSGTSIKDVLRAITRHEG